MNPYEKVKYDNNLQQKIRTELYEDNIDIDEVLDRYPGLEFIHIWKMKPQGQKSSLDAVFLSPDGSIEYILNCAELDPEYDCKYELNTVWELSQRLVKNPFHDRKIDEDESDEIYEALSQLILEKI